MSDINRLRTLVVNEASSSEGDGALVALALVYLGDSIREGTSDIGPAIEGVASTLHTGISVDVTQR